MPVVFSTRQAKRLLEAARIVSTRRQWYSLPKAAPNAASQPRPFIVISESRDYLVCHAWDGETEGAEDVLVAKPWLLQATPFDGQTREGVTFTQTSVSTRTATSGATSETQTIYPAYVPKSATYAGDVIYAIRCQTFAADADGNAITLMEVHSTRQWCGTCVECPA